AAARFGGSSGAASRALPGRDRAPTGYPAGVRAGPERAPAVRWLDAAWRAIHLDDGESGELLIVRSSSPVYPALRLLPAGVSTTMFAPTATRVQGSIVTAYRVIGPWPAGQDAGFIQPQSPCRLEGWDRSGGEAFVRRLRQPDGHLGCGAQRVVHRAVLDRLLHRLPQLGRHRRRRCDPQLDPAYPGRGGRQHLPLAHHP